MGSSICADVPYVFRGGTGQTLDYPALSDYEGSDLVKVNLTGESPTGGSDKSANETMFIKVDEIKVKIDERLEVDSYNSIVINKAASIAADYPGDYTVEQICAIYEYMKEDWRYVRDPRDLEYYRYASDNLQLATEKNCSGIGDCDDFALLIASLIESIGGTTRIILAYGPGGGHAYTEVYLGQIGSEDSNVERIIYWLQNEYDSDIFTHKDLETDDVWLNLDWSANHPGGPFYDAEKNIAIFVRDVSNKVPLNLIIKCFTWSETFDRSGDDRSCSIKETSDGGYIIVGSTWYGAKQYEFWLVKTDLEGNVEWDRTLEGEGVSVLPTTDGEYVIVGGSSGSGWLIKIDSKGSKKWEKFYEGGGSSIQQTYDGGYIIVGSKWVDDVKLYNEICLVKTDSYGNKEWERNFGGPEFELGYSVQQTRDGGYIVTGIKALYGGGDERFWLIKTDSYGNKEWDQTFTISGSGWGGKCVQQTSDGGYIIIGSGDPYDAGNMDVWLIKTDSSGNKEWDRAFGGTESDWGSSVDITYDNGFIIAGSTFSYGEGKSDIWLIKTDSEGYEQWNSTFGSENIDMCPWDNPSESVVQQARDGGYIIVGTTKSSRGDDDDDVWIIKTDSQGNCPQAKEMKTA